MKKVLINDRYHIISRDYSELHRYCINHSIPVGFIHGKCRDINSKLYGHFYLRLWNELENMTIKEKVEYIKEATKLKIGGVL